MDILEIALFAEESGNVYHIYVKINYLVSKQVQLLTGITNRTIETHEIPFRNVMDGRLHYEIKGNATESIRIHVYRHNILPKHKVTYTTTEGVWSG